MEGEELREGRARVRKTLIAPLERAGMVRPAKVTVADHAAMLERVEGRLAYMTAANLAALAEVVERNATGKARNTWPAEVSICNWARKLQEPPASESRLVRSYLQSGAGVAAMRGGYVVELFGYLKRMGQPPTGSFAYSKIKEDADANRRRAARIEEARAAGRADARDLDWLARYSAAYERCRDIVNAREQAA